jgi:hypothetical protein
MHLQVVALLLSVHPSVVAQQAYGDHHYTNVLELWPGDRQKPPTLQAILDSAGFDKVLHEEAAAIVQAHDLYRPLEQRLISKAVAHERRPGELAVTVELEPDLRTGLLDASAALDRAVQGISSLRGLPPGATQPKHALGQLRDASALLKSLASGDIDAEAYDPNMVHQRLALGMRYLVLWARAGFR